MEIITKEYKVYNFDELNDDVKKKLIEKEREYQKESYCEWWLEEDMNYKAKELLYTYLGVNNVDVLPLYDLSYCQGSGAMVEFDIDIKDLNNKYKVFSDNEIRFFKEKDVIDYIKIKHNNSNYYHEYSFKIDCFYYNDWEYDDIKEDYNISEKDFNTLEDRFYELIDMCNKNGSEFIKDIINMNKELSKYGYDCIEYYDNCNDDEIIEHIKNNDNRYLENGDEFYG